jgi:hypothetical protein
VTKKKKKKERAVFLCLFYVRVVRNVTLVKVNGADETMIITCSLTTVLRKTGRGKEWLG